MVTLCRPEDPCPHPTIGRETPGSDSGKLGLKVFVRDPTTGLKFWTVWGLGATLDPGQGPIVTRNLTRWVRGFRSTPCFTVSRPEVGDLDGVGSVQRSPIFFDLFPTHVYKRQDRPPGSQSGVQSFRLSPVPPV